MWIKSPTCPFYSMFITRTPCCGPNKWRTSYAGDFCSSLHQDMLWCRRNFLHPGVKSSWLKDGEKGYGKPTRYGRWSTYIYIYIHIYTYIYISSYYQSPSVESPMICWCWCSCYFHSLHKFVIHLIMGNQLPVLYGWKTGPKHSPTSLLPGFSPLHYTWKSNIVPIWALVWGLGYRLWIWQSIDMLDWHMNLPGFVYTWNEVCEGACAITTGKF